MSRLLPTLALAALVAAGALTLANAAQEPPPPAPPPPPSPAESAPTDPGVALIQGRCAMCHSADFVLQARKPKAAWRDLINEMVAKGAQVSDAEADQIQAYLEKNQSVPPPPEPAGAPKLQTRGQITWLICRPVAGGGSRVACRPCSSAPLASAPLSTTAGPRDEVAALAGRWSDWAFGGFGYSIGLT
jgi:mono/diheme cytochrome c family protein